MDRFEDHPAEKPAQQQRRCLRAPLEQLAEGRQPLLDPGPRGKPHVRVRSLLQALDLDLEGRHRSLGLEKSRGKSLAFLSTANRHEVDDPSDTAPSLGKLRPLAPEQAGARQCRGP